MKQINFTQIVKFKNISLGKKTLKAKTKEDDKGHIIKGSQAI